MPVVGGEYTASGDAGSGVSGAMAVVRRFVVVWRAVCC